MPLENRTEDVFRPGNQLYISRYSLLRRIPFLGQE